LGVGSVFQFLPPKKKRFFSFGLCLAAFSFWFVPCGFFFLVGALLLFSF
jgi:hypothetical protein